MRLPVLLSFFSHLDAHSFVVTHRPAAVRQGSEQFLEHPPQRHSLAHVFWLDRQLARFIPLPNPSSDLRTVTSSHIESHRVTSSHLKTLLFSCVEAGSQVGAVYFPYLPCGFHLPPSTLFLSPALPLHLSLASSHVFDPSYSPSSSCSFYPFCSTSLPLTPRFE